MCESTLLSQLLGVLFLFASFTGGASAGLPPEVQQQRLAKAVHFVMNVETVSVKPKSTWSPGGDAVCVITGTISAMLSLGSPPFGSAPDTQLFPANFRLKVGERNVVTVPCATAGAGFVGTDSWAMPVPTAPLSRLELWSEVRPVNGRWELLPFAAR